MAALTAEAEAGVTATPDSAAPRSDRPANATQADSVEGLLALKFSHACLEAHHSYCINGVCAFHHELEKAICRCFTGYTGERCLNLQSPYHVCSGGRAP
ncbi:epigen [Perognathus longimembris pacificus]|uniref:epigen n=1 Tax=Perognathus longimembris pacificus TaxID=214514 RepID=UPI0020195737|nr:epigen [Perognathus longimembris pacificus]